LFNGVDTPIIHPPVHVATNGEIRLSGWAVDRLAGQPAQAVEVLIDRNRFPTSYGGSRPDVASYLGRAEFTYSGFSFALPATEIGKGRHQMRLRVHVRERNGFLETVPITFSVD